MTAPSPVTDRPADTRLSGRDEQLHLVEGALAAAAAGSGAVLSALGSPGTGKTALLAEARRLARRSGFRVLAETASRHDDRSMPLSGAARLFDIETPASVTMLNERLGRILLDAPVLISVDDCHWFDAASLEWLCTVGVRTAHRRLVVLFTTGPAEGSEHPELMEDLRALCTRRLRLSPLRRHEVQALLTSVLGEAPEAAFTSTCEELTLGNPGLLTTLAEAVREREIRPATEHCELLRSIGLDTLTPLFRSRLRRVSPHAPAVAEIVAVLNTPASAETIANLSELSLETIADVVRALTAHEVIDGGPTAIRLTHDWYRTQLAHGMDPSSLGALHARTAALLVREGAPAARIAEHLMAATTSGRTWPVAPHGQPEARQAVERLAALEESLPEARRPEVALSLAEDIRRTDPRAARRHLVGTLALPLSPQLRDRAAAGLADIGWMLGDGGTPCPGDAPHDTALAIELALQTATTAEKSVGELAALMARSNELPHPTQDLNGRTLSMLAQYTSWNGRNATEARRLAEQALATGIGHTVAGLRALEVLADAEQVGPALDRCHAAVQRLESSGDLPLAATALATRSALYRQQGRLPDAVADARRAVDLMSRAGDVPAGYLARLAEALIDIGDKAAAEQASALTRHTHRAPLSFDGGSLLHSAGRLAIASGNPERGVDHLLSYAEHLRSWSARDWPRLDWRGELVGGLLAVGRTSDALGSAEENVVRSRRWGLPGVVGNALRSRGIARGGKQGLADLEESVSLLEGTPWRHRHAQSLVAYGSALASGGFLADARIILRSAHVLARQCGALGLAEQAGTAHLAAGGRLGRRRADPVALSPAETRVAELAAADLTNAQIAETLRIGIRTVEAHLTRCYRKLSLQGRRQLISEWRRSRLPERENVTRHRRDSTLPAGS